MDITATDVAPVIEPEPIRRATVEDLLGLSVEGWEEIGKMSEEQLAIYLADITILEPKADIDKSMPRGKVEKVEKSTSISTKSKLLQELEDNQDPDNPIKLSKKAPRTPKAPKVPKVFKTIEEMLAEIEEL